MADNSFVDQARSDPEFWRYVQRLTGIINYPASSSTDITIPAAVPLQSMAPTDSGGDEESDVDDSSIQVEPAKWDLGRVISGIKGYFSNPDNFAFTHDVRLWNSGEFRDNLKNSEEFRELSNQLNDLERWSQQVSHQGTRRFLADRIAKARNHTELMRTDVGSGPRALFAAGSVLASAYVIATNFKADHNELYQPFVVASYAKSFLQMGMLTFSEHTDPALMVNHLIERHMLYAAAAGVFGPSTWINSLAHLNHGLPLILGGAASALGVTAAAKGGPALVKTLTKLVNGIGTVAIAPEQQTGLIEVANRLEQTTNWMKQVRAQYTGEPGKRINDSMNEKYSNTLDYLIEL
ncbi:MAG: hypothetical protein ACRC44_03750, partial [Bifidobacterium asteroides]